MDLGTVERRLNASKPGKEDMSSPRYHSVDDFVRDVRLIFTNASAFNGAQHLVTQMANRLDEVFDRQMKHMPPPDDVSITILA